MMPGTESYKIGQFEVGQNLAKYIGQHVMRCANIRNMLINAL